MRKEDPRKDLVRKVELGNLLKGSDFVPPPKRDTGVKASLAYSNPGMQYKKSEILPTSFFLSFPWLTGLRRALAVSISLDEHDFNGFSAWKTREGIKTIIVETKNINTGIDTLSYTYAQT